MAIQILQLETPMHEPRGHAVDYVRGIFNREMGVTLHNAKVGSSRDDAMRELTKTTANLYARRGLRELIQNAFEGAASSWAARILGRSPCPGDPRADAAGTRPGCALWKYPSGGECPHSTDLALGAKAGTSPETGWNARTQDADRR